MKRSVIAIYLAIVFASPLYAGGIPKDPQLVLDLKEGSWRMFMGWKTPTIISEDGKRRGPLVGEKTRSTPNPKPLPVRHSWYPPKNWTAVDFDDTYWPRARGSAVVRQAKRGGRIWDSGNAAMWNLVCLRGSFIVKDPKKIALPRVILRYYGGGIIYVNGKELQRGHLPKGKIDYQTLADPYPLEQYIRPDGKLYVPSDRKVRDYHDRFARRVRAIPPVQWLDAVAIPNNRLRKGVNTIAIEVHAAPVNEAMINRKTATFLEFGYQAWPHAGIVDARMVVGAPNGLIQNVAPEDGLHVSNEHPWETKYVFDYSHPQPSIRPVSLVGVKNGSYSGCLLVSSREDVGDLKVTATELAHAGGQAKLGPVRIRFAAPGNPREGHRRWPRFNRLMGQVPDLIKAVPMKIRGRNLQPIPTVALPVWITVDVPKTAAAGEYKGSVTLVAEYAKAVTVPVQINVCDWALPDTKDYKLDHCIYQSPDSVALFYGVKPWSDEHFQLIRKSFEIADKMGSRVVPISLIIRAPNLNNLESMVRWIKQPDGSYKYDFTVVEKYLDCFAKAVGKPRIIAIYNGGFEGRRNERKPPDVNTLDPKTGKLGTLTAPKYGTKEYTEFWRPVLHDLRERLKTRGWYDVAMIGHISYCWAPSKETAAAIMSIWPDGKWISSCHGYRSRFGRLPVLCNEWIWGCGRYYNPDVHGSRGYPRPWRKTRSGRRCYDHLINRGLDEDNPIPQFYTHPEQMMQRGLHGLGRLGADFWPVKHPKANRLYYLTDGYAGLGIQTTNIAMLGAGPDGPIWTVRAEVFREGVQTAETIVYVREMIDQKKITGELAKRAEALLFNRARHMNHNASRLSGGARERNEKLYELAGEIANAAKNAKD